MPQQPKYISVDPNEGAHAGAGDAKYLSVDPHEGLEVPEGKTLAGFGANVVTSGGKFIANTAEGLLGMAKTIGKNATAAALPTPENIFAAAADPGNQGVAHMALHPLETAGRVVTYARDRYGSPGKVLDTLYSDPVGALADASTVASVGGGALSKAGQLAKVPALVRAGEAVSALDPVVVAGKAIRKIPVRDLSEAAAERWADSALKVKETLREANPGVNIPLETAREGAVASRGGLRDLNTRLDALSGEVSNAIGASNATIKPADAAQQAQALLADRTRLRQVAPQDPRIIKQSVQAFLGNRRPIPVATAQDMKDLLGDKLANTFGAEVVPATSEAQDALRAGLRSEIEKAVPGVVGPNAQMSRLIPVRDAVQDAVNRSRRWDIAQAAKVGSGSVIGGLVGMGTGHPDLGALAGALGARLLENPALKTRIATATLRAGEAAPTIGAAGEAIAPWLVRLALLQQMGDQPDAQPAPSTPQP